MDFNTQGQDGLENQAAEIVIDEQEQATPTPEGVTLPKEEWEQTQATIQALQQKLADTEQFFQKQDLPSKEQLHKMMVDDPNAFVGFTQKQIEANLQKQLEIQNVVNKFRAENPDLLPYEKYINAELQQVISEQPNLAFEKAVSKATANFKKAFPNLAGGQVPRPQNLDVKNAGQGKPSVSNAERIAQMSDAEFLAYRNKIVGV